MKGIWNIIVLCIVFMLLNRGVEANTVVLHFRVSMSNSSAPVTGDVFRAVASDTEGVISGFDSKDLLKPPGAPAKDFILAKTFDTGKNLIGDYRPYDPNTIDIVFPIELDAHSENPAGLSGEIHFTLTNPQQLEELPNDAMVYVKRYDSSGGFVARYDLAEAANHALSWQVTDGRGLIATMELVVRDSCTAADINRSGTVDLGDLEALSTGWQKDGSTGDVDGDNSTDIKDLAMIAQFWLCDCSEK